MNKPINFDSVFSENMRVLKEMFQENRFVLVSIQLSLFALAMWTFSLANIDLAGMNDLGLVSVLPPGFFVGVGCLVISFGLMLSQDKYAVPVLVFQTCLLILMLFGTAPILEPMPRTAISIKLVGLINSIRETGSVNPYTDAFNNWPGFFILIAFLTEAVGIERTLSLASWAPVLLNLLYLGPLILVFRTGTRSKRLIWIGVWLFYLFNWIGQDYLSPQGFSYFFYLVILGILLNWFRTTPPQREWFYQRWLGRSIPERIKSEAARYYRLGGVPDRPSLAWQRVGLLAVVVVLFSVIVPSHQLTPFAVIGAVTTLILFNRLTPRGLPVIMAFIAGAWIVYMTVPYLTGHIQDILGPIGSITRNLDANLSARFTGSPLHVKVLQIRMGTALLLLVLAALGFLRRMFTGRLDLDFGILAIVPFTLIALQVYGGELLLRSYLFALPFLSFFAASLFNPTHQTNPARRNILGICATGCLLAIAFFITRHGNERADYFSPQEVEAIAQLYDMAEPGSHMLAVTDFLPWRFEGYAAHRYTTIWQLAKEPDLEELAILMNNQNDMDSYLILTRSQAASTELFLGWPPETWDRFTAALSSSDQFKLIYENDEAQIYTLSGQETGLGTLVNDNPNTLGLEGKLISPVLTGTPSELR